jgi:glutathione synthase
MSKRNLAVVMDPIGAINPQNDSTLAMLLAAQSREWQIHYAELQDIWLRDGDAFGRLRTLQVADDETEWFDLGDAEVTPLANMDIILMRKDPPFDMEYIVSTYILQRAEDQGAMVVNRPQALRDANEKAFLSWFPQCGPPTLISRSIEDMSTFINEHRKAVVKPLDKMAGRSVFVTGVDDGNRNVILETVTDDGTRYAMVQKYIPEIASSGDKRILLIDGEPFPQALVRIPAPGDHRGNICAGARTEVESLTDRDRWICGQVGPVLSDKGLVFAGIDIIGDYLTEINVTSPTGIRELDRACDARIGEQLMDAILFKLAKQAHTHNRAVPCFVSGEAQ